VLVDPRRPWEIFGESQRTFEDPENLRSGFGRALRANLERDGHSWQEIAKTVFD